MSEKMEINHVILRWAREVSGYSSTAACKAFGNNKYIDWENGKDFPTYIELKKIGKFFKKPIAIFFFAEIPKLHDIKSSFRTLEFSIFTPELISLIEWGRILQLNLYELHDGINPSEKLITQYSFDLSSIESTASNLRSLINVNLVEQKKLNSYEVAFNFWREIFFNIGIYVFKNAFKNDKISGFCIFDDIFPIICVNNSLAFQRQIFTLFHELYHLLYNTSGIDFVDESTLLTSEQIEIKCNEFAGVFLVPDEDFILEIDKITINDDNIQKLAKLYSVSREVILRKLLNNKIITNEFYNSKCIELYSDNLRNFEKNNQSTEKAKGNYYNSLISYKGSHYINLAYSSYYAQKITLPQLAQYMNMKIPSLKNLAFKLNWGNL
jgi:Zn-dependent peptidase ImmA (M78 family)/transcriptional regulator with XRE-family HTH domain